VLAVWKEPHATLRFAIARVYITFVKQVAEDVKKKKRKRACDKKLPAFLADEA
jgi:hypothetical protein